MFDIFPRLHWLIQSFQIRDRKKKYMGERIKKKILKLLIHLYWHGKFPLNLVNQAFYMLVNVYHFPMTISLWSNGYCARPLLPYEFDPHWVSLGALYQIMKVYINTDQYPVNMLGNWLYFRYLFAYCFTANTKRLLKA